MNPSKLENILWAIGSTAFLAWLGYITFPVAS